MSEIDDDMEYFEGRVMLDKQLKYQITHIQDILNKQYSEKWSRKNFSEEVINQHEQNELVIRKTKTLMEEMKKNIEESR